MKNILIYSFIICSLISCTKKNEYVFLDSESVEQNNLKQQIISILGYAEEDIEFDDV